MVRILSTRHGTTVQRRRKLRIYVVKEQGRGLTKRRLVDVYLLVDAINADGFGLEEVKPSVHSETVSHLPGERFRGTRLRPVVKDSSWTVHTLLTAGVTPLFTSGGWTLVRVRHIRLVRDRSPGEGGRRKPSLSPVRHPSNHHLLSEVPTGLLRQKFSLDPSEHLHL